jgi:hypothetical protein
LIFLLFAGCDFNPLGGSKSNLDPTFEPGKHVPSAPPVISAIADYTIDENDVQSINFTIGDPDTFMVCSLVFVKATSSNNTLIDSSGLTVSGTYPNCKLRIAPKAFQFGTADITVTVYDFWTYARSTFRLNVIHIETPGVFNITDAVGGNTTVDITWQNAAYMLNTGAFTSPYYNLYYRQAYTTGGFTEIARVTSPYLVTGLTNGVEYEFYVLAHNSIGERVSNTVIAEPTRFQVRGGTFLASGSSSADTTTATQYVNSAGTANGTIYVGNSSLLPEVDQDSDGNYPIVCTGVGTPISQCTGAGTLAKYEQAENPTNDPSPAALPGSSTVTPSGRYKVYLNSQSNILSGVGQ